MHYNFSAITCSLHHNLRPNAPVLYSALPAPAVTSDVRINVTMFLAAATLALTSVRHYWLRLRRSCYLNRTLCEGGQGRFQTQQISRRLSLKYAKC